MFTVRTLVGFFGAQSAAGVGLGVGAGGRWSASVRRAATLSSAFLLSSGNVAAFKCYPSMPGPNLGASQIGLVLVDVPVCVCLAKKRE